MYNYAATYICVVNRYVYYVCKANVAVYSSDSFIICNHF